MEQQQQQAFAAIVDAMYKADHMCFSVPEAGTMVTADGRFTVTMRAAHPGEFLDRDGINSDINSCWFVRDNTAATTTLAAVVFKHRAQDEDAGVINDQYCTIEQLMCSIFEEEVDMDYHAFLGLPPDALSTEVLDRLYECGVHTNFSWICPDEAAVRTDIAERNLREEEDE